MITCAKDYSIQIVGLNPAAWFPMETAGASLTDSVNGNDAVLSGFSTGIATTSAGKVDLAATLGVQLASAIYDTPLANALGFTGQDINIFGWVFFSSSAGRTMTITLASSLGETLEVSFQPGGGYSVNSGALAGAAPASGAFFFFRLHWDSATQKVGIAFNNAAPTYEAGNTVFAVTAQGFLDITFTNALTGANQQKLDELAIFFGTMSQSEIDSVYAGGAGRTWP